MSKKSYVEQFYNYIDHKCDFGTKHRTDYECKGYSAPLWRNPAPKLFVIMSIV